MENHIKFDESQYVKVSNKILHGMTNNKIETKNSIAPAINRKKYKRK